MQPCICIFGGYVYGRKRAPGRGGGFEFLYLLVEVLIELGALDEGCVRLLDLVAVEGCEDGADVIDELVYPAEV